MKFAQYILYMVVSLQLGTPSVNADSYFALKLIKGEISVWTGNISSKNPDIYAEAMLATYYIIQAGKLKGEDLKYRWDEDCEAYAN